jgi:hypothetical protein
MQLLVSLFVLYFGLLALSMFYRKQTIRGPWFFLLRAFFPNWQFYHQVGPVPHLYARFATANGELGEWQWIYPRQPRKLWHVFHNPWGNRDLALQNLVDHLSSDIKELGEGADASHLVSYQLVCRHAQQAVRAHRGSALPDGTVSGSYQLEIRLERPGPQGLISSDTVLRSPLLPC